MLQDLNRTIAHANLAITNITTHFGAQLQHAWQELDQMPFKLWSSLFHSDSLLSLLVAVLSTGIKWLTPILVLVQGIRFKFAVSLLSAMWLTAWLCLSRDTFACIMVFIFIQFGAFSASEIIAWFWTTDTAHSLCPSLTTQV
jgi:hypothetical protein